MQTVTDQSQYKSLLGGDKGRRGAYTIDLVGERLNLIPSLLHRSSLQVQSIPTLFQVGRQRSDLIKSILIQVQYGISSRREVREGSGGCTHVQLNPSHDRLL